MKILLMSICNFRGSSSIIESMSQVIPIYLKINDDINIDALNLTPFRHKSLNKKIFQYLKDVVDNNKLNDVIKILRFIKKFSL